jgi:hypothetical protein
MTLRACSAILFGVTITMSLAAPAAQNPEPSLMTGRFVFVGRNPDNGSTYSGSAIISRLENGFALQRTIGPDTIEARGTIEVPNPPGEGTVLRFRWNDGNRKLMTCLISSDLDNYPRLTCYWLIEGKEHFAPGLEAYFSTEMWPDNRSG